jgi:hypothetical protein
MLALCRATDPDIEIKQSQRQSPLSVQKKRQDFSLAFKMANRLIDKGINLDASI